MRKKLFLLGVMIGGLLVVAALVFSVNEKEELWEMNPDLGYSLLAGTYDIKGYHFQNGKLVDETVIYEQIEVASDGILFLAENNFADPFYTIRVYQDEREAIKTYAIHMKQDLDWKGGGLLFGEGIMREAFIIDQEYALAFRAATAGSYQSVANSILEMTEFTELETAFEALDELVIFTMIQ